MPNSNPTLLVPISDQVANEDVFFAINVRNNFKDLDNDTLTFSIAGQLPDGLTLNAATGVIEGTPTNAAVGTQTIVVTANDGNGGTASDTFILTILNTNDAPTATPILDAIATEDQTFTLNVKPSFTDIDIGDTLTFAATGLPEGLTINPSTGVISGNPTNAAVGSATITVTASDGKGGGVSTNFLLTVNNTNDDPTIATPIADRSISEDTFVSISIRNNFTDIDLGDQLSFTAQGLPAGLTMSSAGVISGTPTNAVVGNHTITITANDGNNGTVSDTFILTVTNTNDAPTILTEISDKTIAEDSAVTINLTSAFQDIDAGDVLTYTVIGLPDGLTINSATGVISGSATNSAVGTRNITVTASDGKGGIVRDVFALTVTNTNDAPTIATLIPDRTATEDSFFTLNVRSNFADIDAGDGLTFTSTNLPPGFSLNATTGVLSGIPTNDLVGNNTITITVTDAAGSKVEDSFVLAVVNTNDAPTLLNPIPDQITSEDTVVTISVSSFFSDVDAGNTLTYSATGLPSGLTINATTGVINGTPTNDAVGTRPVTVTANDNKGGTVTGTFNLTVNNANDDPTVLRAIANQTAVEDQLFNFNVSGSFTDMDNGDVLVYFVDRLPDGLTLDKNTGTISGTPTNLAVGNNSITITASDGNGGRVSSSFTLNVANANDAPLLKAPLPSQTATEDVSFNLNFSNSFVDPDNGDTLTFSVMGLPEGLTFNNTTGGISGSATNAAVGTRDITVTANDGKGGTTSGSFALTVLNSNDDPTVRATIGNQTATEDTAFSLNISGNFVDIDAGDVLTYSASGLPDGLSIDANSGVISGSPTNAAVGNHTITVVASDSKGTAPSDTFTLVVSNANDAPTVATEIADRTATEETAFTLDISSNFTDPDEGDTLTFSAQGLPDGLTLDTSTGIISGLPTNAAVGTKEVTITAQDGQGGMVTDVLTITTVNTNDDPTVKMPIVTRAVTQNVAFNLNLSSSFDDIDVGDLLTYRATGLPTGLTLEESTGILSGTVTELTPIANISIIANDGNGGQISDTFELTVTANTAPMLAVPLADQVTDANRAFSLVVTENTFSNLDPNDSLSFTAQLDNGSPLPEWLSFDPATRTFSGTPTNAQAGAVNIKVTAIDGAGTTVSDVFALKVNAVTLPTSPTGNRPSTPGVVRSIGEDATIAGSEGRDRLTGTDKAETLLGLGGNDSLKGNGGNDKLVGGSGSDKLFGGKGNDVFVLEKGPGFDVIQDFQNGRDRLAMMGLNVKKLGISQRGRNTMISFGKDELALLIGVKANQINGRDFMKI